MAKPKRDFYDLVMLFLVFVGTVAAVITMYIAATNIPQIQQGVANLVKSYNETVSDHLTYGENVQVSIIRANTTNKTNATEGCRDYPVEGLNATLHICDVAKS